MIFGGIFLVIVLAIGGMGLFAWYKTSQYDDTAVPYVKTTMPELSKWNPEITKKYMAPEVMEQTTDKHFTKVNKYLSKLGPLVSFEEPSFTNIHTGATFENGKQTIVTYTIDAKYENGDAVISISLLDLGNSFQVWKFNVNSSALMN